MTGAGRGEGGIGAAGRGAGRADAPGGAGGRGEQRRGAGARQGAGDTGARPYDAGSTAQPHGAGSAARPHGAGSAGERRPAARRHGGDALVRGGRVGLAARDPQLRELMDDPDCDPRRLAATLRRFDTVNRLVSGWDRVYRTHLRPHLAGLGRPARVLDLGCGGGDVLVRLAGHARRDGLRVSWLGVDPDPRAIAVAATRAAPDVAFRPTDSTGLRDDGERFDAVISNHVLHHLEEAELRGFAADSRALSRGIVLHGDIARDRMAFGLYGIGILPLAPGTFLRTDGLRSIRRSYRAEELAAALGAGWRIERPGAFRLLAVGAGDA